MNSTNDWVLRENMDVLASDGEKVGEVKDAMGESFSVKEGWFFPKEHIIPSTVITSVDDNAVYLGVMKDQALAEDWGAATTATGSTWGNTPTADQTATGSNYDAAMGTDRSAGATDTLGSAFDKTKVDDRAAGAADTLGDAYDKTKVDDRLTGTASDTYNDAATSKKRGGAKTTDTDVNATDTDSIRVPLSEEELVATRKDVERGKVRVERNVVSEEQSLDVPVTEEEVHVARRVIDRDVAPGEDAFQEGTIEIPVRGEEVVAEKRTRVTGELDISKRAATHTEHVSDTVRHEEAHVVDENGNVVDDGTAVAGTQRPARKKT